MSTTYLGTDHLLLQPLADLEHQINRHERRVDVIRKGYERTNGRLTWSVIVNKYGETLAEAILCDIEESDDLYAAFAKGVSGSACALDPDMPAKYGRTVFNALGNTAFSRDLLIAWLIQGEDSHSPWFDFTNLFLARHEDRCELEAIRSAA